MPHSDKNIYFINMVRSRLVQYGREEGMMISDLIQLGQEIEDRKTAVELPEKLMELFDHTLHWGEIDRVCLVQRLVGSYELMVLGSSVSSKVGDNSMVEGYRCFVNPNGSLLEMKPNTLRCFSDVNKVIQDFESEARPVQRSMGFIRDMKLQSGVSMPIYLHGQLEGWIFFNSLSSERFSTLNDEDCGIWCLIQLLAKQALGLWVLPESRFTKMNRESETLWRTRLFEEKVFSSLCMLTLEGALGCAVDVLLEIEDDLTFLYSPIRLIRILYFIFLHSPKAEAIKSLKVSVEKDGDNVVLKLNHDFDTDHTLDSIRLTELLGRFKEEALHMGFAVEVEGEKLSLSFPFDPGLGNYNGEQYSAYLG